MSKILVMSDLHLVPEGARIIGLDPWVRLGAALDHARAHQADAEHLVLMGDLTHHGTAAEYARLAEALRDLPWPVSFMLGNHDDRAEFLRSFPRVRPDPSGFVQRIVDLPDVRLILLDSLDAGGPVRHAGVICPQRMAWLEAALCCDLPCLVFVHHPPFDTGFDGMDAIGLRNAAALRAMVRGRAVQVLAGHIHRTITAMVEGVMVTTFKSPCHQMPMKLGAAGSGHSVDEPGAYGIVLTRGRDVVVHFEDVLERPVLDDPASA